MLQLQHDKKKKKKKLFSSLGKSIKVSGPGYSYL